MASEPEPRKQAKAAPLIEGFPLAWRFSSSDKGGPWAWTKLKDAEEHKKVIERLREFENKNWEEIKSTGSHPVAKNKLVQHALDRLEEIQQDDIDELLSLRVSGANRVWCIKDRNILKVLWWDPEHEVCPSPKKHT